ncbi:hypothetical protein D3C80_2219540 [compost metagenome]
MVTPSSVTGWNSGVRAWAFSAVKSRPASWNSFSATAPWIQPWAATRSLSGSARTMSNLGAVEEFSSVDQG